MLKSFKLRYVNEIVGVFVLVAVGFVVTGIVATIRAKDWFQPALQIKIPLPDEGAMGLKPGDNVQVLGTVIGAVESVNYNRSEGRMEAVLSVRGNLLDYLRDNSIPIIHKSFGIGEPFIEIIRNPNEPGNPLSHTDTQLYYSKADQGATDKIDEILHQIQDQAVPAIGEARAAIREYTQLAADLRNPDKPLQQTIAHLSKITASIENGEGLVGRLLGDKQMAGQVTALLPKLNAAFDEMKEVLQNLGKTSGNLSDLTASAKVDMKRLPALLDSTRDTMIELQATLKDVRKTTSKLPDLVDSAGQTVAMLPGVMLQLQETMRQMQILVEGAQQSFLFRSHIDKSEPTGRIRADEIGK